MEINDENNNTNPVISTKSREQGPSDTKKIKKNETPDVN